MSHNSTSSHTTTSDTSSSPVWAEDEDATLYTISQFTNDSTLQNDGSTLHRMFLAQLSDSGYLSASKTEKNEIRSASGEDTSVSMHPEEDEDPYRWYILLGGFLAQAISMSTLSSVMQDYYDRQVFKGAVDSTQLSFVGTIGFTFCGLMGPISQILTRVIGPRWVMLIGTLFMTAGLVLASFSKQVWHLYITQSVVHGIGSALLYIVSMSLSPQWFVKRRGFAMGVMVSGSGVGGLIMPFVMNVLNESLGGAWCYRVLGIITFAVSMIATLLLKEKPGTEPKNNVPFKDIVDFSVCKDFKFIIWCVAGNLSMMAYFIPAFYLPSHATKLGLSPSQGSILVAVFSAVNVVGRVLSGYIGDHIGVVNIDIIFLAVCGMSSCFIWMFAQSYEVLMLFILIYGLTSGAVFSLLAPITATITGMDKYPSGISLYLFFMTAARLGPSLAGAIQTATNKNSFFAQEMFTGLAFLLSAVVTVYLKFMLKRKPFAKI